MKSTDRNTDQHEPVNAHVKPWSNAVRNVSYGANLDALTWAERIPGLSPSESATLSLIASRSRFRTWDGFRWTLGLISSWTGYGRSAVAKAIRRLRDVCLILVDGSVPTKGPGRVVSYRLNGTPDHPLPLAVVQSRDPDWILPDVQDQKSLTSKDTHKTTVNPPRGPVEIIKEPTAVQDQKLPRSVADESSPDVTRKTPEREIPTWAHPVADRLTTDQTRRITAIGTATMTRDGIGPVRLAARVRAWWRFTGSTPIRSAFGWLWHAVERRPYGCADPRCEDGDVWDGDRITGRCAGCAERRMDRAATKRSGTAPAAPQTRPWTPVWVSDRTDARRALTALLAGPVPVPG